jgi:hypothetical protein
MSEGYDKTAFSDGMNEAIGYEPYDVATYLIVQAIRGAMVHMEAMNAQEIRVLNELDRFFSIIDPNQHGRVNVSSGEAMNE